jgi:hypothetical protein
MDCASFMFNDFVDLLLICRFYYSVNLLPLLLLVLGSQQTQGEVN